MDSINEFLSITHLRTPCDLDVVIFFARHPDALMTSEQLALLVGYDLSQVAKSLDLLVEHKVLQRSQNPTHVARLYRFRAEHWNPRFHDTLKMASTVEGRRQIRRVLNQRQRSKRTTPTSLLAKPKNQRPHRKEQNLHASQKKERANG
jgi:hypothetical protein